MWTWGGECVCACKYVLEWTQSMIFLGPTASQMKWKGSAVLCEKWNMRLTFCWWTNMAEVLEQICRGGSFNLGGFSWSIYDVFMPQRNSSLAKNMSPPCRTLFWCINLSERNEIHRWFYKAMLWSIQGVLSALWKPRYKSMHHMHLLLDLRTTFDIFHELQTHFTSIRIVICNWKSSLTNCWTK